MLNVDENCKKLKVAAHLSVYKGEKSNALSRTSSNIATKESPHSSSPDQSNYLKVSKSMFINRC